MEDEKIRNAKYNKRYKALEMGNAKPSFLRKEILDRYMYGDEIRALIKIRCGNLEDNNKYWLGDECKACKFCNIGRDNIEHFVMECVVTKE